MRHVSDQRARAQRLAVVPAPSAAESAMFVCVLLSRLLGLSKAWRHAATTILCRATALYGSNGTVEGKLRLPASHPHLRSGPWPTAQTAFRRLGTDQDALHHRFEALRHWNGVHASFEPEVVAEFFPRVLWPVVVTMVMDGPGRARMRAERAVREYAATPVAANKRRAKGPPTRGSVEGVRYALHRLFGGLAELNSDDYEFPGIDRWTAPPRIGMPDVPPGRWDTSAPRPELVRQCWADAMAKAADALGISPGDDELAALEAMTDSALVQSPLFRPLRDRVFLGIMMLTGARVNAIAQLRRSDFVTDHVGPAPDYRRSAALMVRPRKTLHETVVRAKPISGEFAGTIQVWLRYSERVVSVLRRWHRGGRPRPEELHADSPLLVSDRINVRPMTAMSMRTLCSGDPPSKGCRGNRALIPRESGFNPDLPAGHRPYVGYPPHSFRHAAQQLAERAGEIWNREHPATGAHPTPEPALYGSALLDHKPKGDALRALYSDRGTEAAYELLSGRAIEIAWRLLTTDEGARRRPDVSTYVRIRKELAAVEAEIARRREAMDRRYRQQPPSDHRALLAYVADSQRQFAQHADYVDRLNERRNQLTVGLEQLRHDQALWLPIPDTEPPGAERIDWDAIDQRLGDTPASRANAPRPVRDWLTFAEFASVRGIEARSTVPRWAEGQNLSDRPTRRPFEPAAIPLDASLGKHYRRIWVPGVHDAFWPTATIRDRLGQALSRWPDQQGWLVDGKPGPRCTAPLRLPSPFAAAYARTHRRGPRTH